ncbi:unnamed protein product [Lymnaea stagnalis]|uniref:Cilia- and flagella-associated protein HOATZ n=1 Tax=Lymnaea stagnalis TaxID=6523 RepID=A0AAV2I753_LYMST
MAVRLLDLSKQPERCTFNQSTQEEMNYGETFWHSLRLQPPMESRLVSSDIKQRLGTKKLTPKSSIDSTQKTVEQDDKIKMFFTRVYAMDQLAQYNRLCALAEARIKERNVMLKRKEERLKKEAIRNTAAPKPKEPARKTDQENRKIGEAYSIKDLIKDLDEFDEKVGKLEAERKEKRDKLVDIYCSSDFKKKETENVVISELFQKSSIRPTTLLPLQFKENLL